MDDRFSTISSARWSMISGLNQIPNGLSRNPSCEDYGRANDLMLQHRVEVGSRKTGAFGIKEANPVLAKIARGSVPNATPGLVQALLDKGGNVCFERTKSKSIIKRLTGQDQLNIPSNLLEQATRNSTEDILTVLAYVANERCLNEALPVAISQGDTAKTVILLARGANASSLCKSFLEVVHSGSDEMVEILLGDVGGACQTCRDKGLAEAAMLGHEAKIRLLLERGADITANDAAAILGASESEREKIAVDLVALGRKKLKHTTLDMILEQAYRREQYQLVTKCLQEGARGAKTNATLTMAVKKQQLELVDELIRYGAAVVDGDDALGFAVQSGRCDLVQKILQCRPQESILADAMARTVGLVDLGIAYKMINLLLSTGLRGDPVSELLIKVVDKALMPGNDDTRLEVLQLLLTKGAADVNLHNGRCIVATISGGCLQMLPILLQYHPSLKSLSASLEAAMDLPMLDLRRNVVGRILKAGSLESDNDQPLLCAAVSAAARRLLLDDVQELVKLGPSDTVCLAGFTAAISTRDKWLTPNGFTVVKVLLDCGAFGVDVDDAFCRAAVLFHHDAVELLANSVSPEALDKALQCVIDHSEDWQLPENFWLLRLILELGQDMESKLNSANCALLKAVQAYVAGSASEDLIDLLLTVGAHADVNSNDGKALKMAVRACHLLLLEKLILSGAVKETKTAVFHTIITEPLKEDNVIALLKVLFKCDISADSEARCDVRATLISGFPPIVECLSAHPQSVKLLKLLINLGCDLETEFQWMLYEEKEIGEEAATVLMWAMGYETIASELIETLVLAKANINFIAPISRSTPLIMAVRCGRKGIVGKLIAAKAAVSERDIFRRSALFYASRYGDLESAKDLAISNPINYDGSLHEAARNLHSKVVALLIKNKHDVNFPCGRHQGRTALQELVYKCDGTASSLRLEETILALMKGNANALTKHNQTGQNALFLAMENPHPYAVTQALLDSTMWRDIKNDRNIFTIEDPETGIRHSYSPTMYIKKGCYKGDSKQGEELLWLLQEKGCPDRFFAQSGPQPGDAVGVPDNLRKTEERRRMEQRRRNEEEMAKRRLSGLEQNLQRKSRASLR